MSRLTTMIAFAILSRRIKHLHGRNDRGNLLIIEGAALFKALTVPQKRHMIIRKAEAAAFDITARLCNGTLTPMMLSANSKTPAVYTYYMRYLANAVYQEDAQKAQILARDVYADIYQNKLIANKNRWDERYFDVIFGWCRGDVQQKIEKGSRILETKIQCEG